MDVSAIWAEIVQIKKRLADLDVVNNIRGPVIDNLNHRLCELEEIHEGCGESIMKEQLERVEKLEKRYEQLGCYLMNLHERLLDDEIKILEHGEKIEDSNYAISQNCGRLNHLEGIHEEVEILDDLDDLLEDIESLGDDDLEIDEQDAECFACDIGRCDDCPNRLTDCLSWPQRVLGTMSPPHQSRIGHCWSNEELDWLDEEFNAWLHLHAEMCGRTPLALKYQVRDKILGGNLC